jgi:hypothetical protein
MSTFDPNEIRKAVAEFTPRRTQKFQDLIPAKEVIVELRHKNASYRSIADLLTQHCLPTSKTAIAMFCHQILGESIRPRRRPLRRRPTAPQSVGGEPAEATPALPTQAGSPSEIAANSSGDESSQMRPRGPRIAQIRKLNPPSHEKTDSHP